MTHPESGNGCPPGWLDLLVENSRGFALMMLDRAGRILAWPGSAQHVFGYPPQAVLGRDFGLLFIPEDRALALPELELQTALRAGFAEDDRWHVRQDGSRLWASGVVAPMRSESGELLGYAKLLRDRTDLRTQTESLKNQLRQCREEADRREDFLALIAHELRNPLMPIGAATQLVRRLCEGDPRVGTALQIIERQVAGLERLVEDLLDLARVRAGKLVLHFERVPLQDAVGSAVSALRAAADQKGVALNAVWPDAPIDIEVDRERFAQIMANLIGNAVKFTPAGGHVWVKVNVDNGRAMIRVQDDGIGIPASLQARVFTLFAQAALPSEGRRGGLGIGLGVVKELVSAHNGTVSVRSEGEGKGSEFVVRLPLTQTPPRTPDAA